MLESNVNSKIEFYSQEKYVNDPFHPAGFAGTWAISDHTRIPEQVVEYLQYKFQVSRLRRVPLEDINQALNEVWEGPGSLSKVFLLAEELRKTASDFKVGILDSPNKKSKQEENEDDEYIADIPLSNFGSNDDSEEES
jgi:hypothetical protein